MPSGINPKNGPVFGLGHQDATDELRAQTEGWDAMSGAISRATLKVSFWLAATSIVFGTVRQITGVVQSWSELGIAIERVGITTDKVGKSLYQYFDAASRIAIQMGVPIKDTLVGLDLTLRATASYGDTAKRTATALTLLRDASILSNLTGMSYAQTTDILVSSLKQSHLELNQGILLLDKWTKISKTAATSVSDLSTSFSIFADAANAAGMTVDQTNAIIAAFGQMVTMSPSELGTSIRSMMSSLFNEGSIKILGKFGVSLRTTSGEFREFWDVMSQLSSMKLAGVLSEAQWLEIAKAAGGGSRRYAQFIALLNSWPTAQAGVTTSISANGEALNANARIVETLTNTFDRLVGAQQKLTYAFGESSGIIKDVTGLLSAMVGQSESLADSASNSGWPKLIRNLGEMAIVFGGVKFLAGATGAIPRIITNRLYMTPDRQKSMLAEQLTAKGLSPEMIKQRQLANTAEITAGYHKEKGYLLIPNSPGFEEKPKAQLERIKLEKEYNRGLKARLTASQRDQAVDIKAQQAAFVPKYPTAYEAAKGRISSIGASGKGVLSNLAVGYGIRQPNIKPQIEKITADATKNILDPVKKNIEKNISAVSERMVNVPPIISNKELEKFLGPLAYENVGSGQQLRSAKELRKLYAQQADELALLGPPGAPVSVQRPRYSRAAMPRTELDLISGNIPTKIISKKEAEAVRQLEIEKNRTDLANATLRRDKTIADQTTVVRQQTVEAAKTQAKAQIKAAATSVWGGVKGALKSGLPTSLSQAGGRALGAAPYAFVAANIAQEAGIISDSAWESGGMIVGSTVGFVLQGPVGAAAGAVIGTMAGKAITESTTPWIEKLNKATIASMTVAGFTQDQINKIIGAEPAPEKEFAKQQEAGAKTIRELEDKLAITKKEQDSLRTKRDWAASLPQPFSFLAKGMGMGTKEYYETKINETKSAIPDIEAQIKAAKELFTKVTAPEVKPTYLDEFYKSTKTLAATSGANAVEQSLLEQAKRTPTLSVDELLGKTTDITGATTAWTSTLRGLQLMEEELVNTGKKPSKAFAEGWSKVSIADILDDPEAFRGISELVSDFITQTNTKIEQSKSAETYRDSFIKNIKSLQGVFDDIIAPSKEQQENLLIDPDEVLKNIKFTKEQIKQFSLAIEGDKDLGIAPTFKGTKGQEEAASRLLFAITHMNEALESEDASVVQLAKDWELLEPIFNRIGKHGGKLEIFAPEIDMEAYDKEYARLKEWFEVHEIPIDESYVKIIPEGVRGEPLSRQQDEQVAALAKANLQQDAYKLDMFPQDVDPMVIMNLAKSFDEVAESAGASLKKNYIIAAQDVGATLPKFIKLPDAFSSEGQSYAEDFLKKTKPRIEFVSEDIDLGKVIAYAQKAEAILEPLGLEQQLTKLIREMPEGLSVPIELTVSPEALSQGLRMAQQKAKTSIEFIDFAPTAENQKALKAYADYFSAQMTENKLGAALGESVEIGIAQKDQDGLLKFGDKFDMSVMAFQYAVEQMGQSKYNLETVEKFTPEKLDYIKARVPELEKLYKASGLEESLSAKESFAIMSSTNGMLEGLKYLLKTNPEIFRQVMEEVGAKFDKVAEKLEGEYNIPSDYAVPGRFWWYKETGSTEFGPEQKSDYKTFEKYLEAKVKTEPGAVAGTLPNTVAPTLNKELPEEVKAFYDGTKVYTDANTVAANTQIAAANTIQSAGNTIQSAGTTFATAANLIGQYLLPGLPNLLKYMQDLQDKAVRGNFTPTIGPDLSPDRPGFFQGVSKTKPNFDTIYGQESFRNDTGLSAEQAAAACGPAAAISFFQSMGRYPNKTEALELARQVGWDKDGMKGPGSEQRLISLIGSSMGAPIPTKLLATQGIRQEFSDMDYNSIIDTLKADNPVLFSTPDHYFAGNDYDPTTGKVYVGASGTIMSKRGGSDWMSIEDMARVGGGMQGAILPESIQTWQKGGGNFAPQNIFDMSSTNAILGTINIGIELTNSKLDTIQNSLLSINSSIRNQKIITASAPLTSFGTMADIVI